MFDPLEWFDDLFDLFMEYWPYWIVIAVGIVGIIVYMFIGGGVL